MDKRRYPYPDNTGGMAAEPSVGYTVAMHETEVLHHRHTDASSVNEPQLTRKEGEELLRRTFVPALRDTKETIKRNEHLPDAHDLLFIEDIWQA